MTPTIDDHAARFDAAAAEYDDQERPVYAACASLVIAAADPGPDDVVLDLGTGTGAIALALADDAARVVGRDISEGMLERAREKAADREHVSFGIGRFRDPQYDGPADVVVSNYAMHHLDDDEKREAITRISAYEPRRFVLGDLMFFDGYSEEGDDYDPDVDDPATVGTLVTMLTDAGFVITDVTPVTDQAGVIVADRR